MSDSDSSGLSPPPSSDNEEPIPIKSEPKKTLKVKGGKLTGALADVPSSPTPEPQSPQREPSPPHEYVLADNPDIPFLVMFRSRFSLAFPKNLPNLGPQDIERGIVDTPPSEQMENFLCALLSLVLNRKKLVERGHYGRALEEAIAANKHQWPRSWNDTNPLPGAKTFSDLTPQERIGLLRTLVLWSLTSSDYINDYIKDSYRQSRREDDLNQPLSVQSWGTDSRRRRYWLIEGLNDTDFRLYRESAARINKNTWWSIAGNLDELKAVAENLIREDGQAAKRLGAKINASMTRFEATEERRKRKEYRQARRAAFARPEPGFSLYEGRTRGKRMKYTFSDDEDDGSDATSVRRSLRQQNSATAAEVSGPTVTLSGRQVRSRFGRSYGEPMHTSREGSAMNEPSEGGDEQRSDSVDPLQLPNGRSTRAARGRSNMLPGPGREDYKSDNMSDDDGPVSGEEWDGDDNDVEGKYDKEEDGDVSSDSDASMMDDGQKSLVVTLRYGKELTGLNDQDVYMNGNAQQDESRPKTPVSPMKVDPQSPTLTFRPLPQPHPSSMAQAPAAPTMPEPSSVAGLASTDPPTSEATAPALAPSQPDSQYSKEPHMPLSTASQTFALQHPTPIPTKPSSPSVPQQSYFQYDSPSTQSSIANSASSNDSAHFDVEPSYKGVYISPQGGTRQNGHAPDEAKSLLHPPSHQFNTMSPHASEKQYGQDNSDKPILNTF